MNMELTIFTPTYNRAKTLPRLFESLKMQTRKNFEWLVIDDGSSDNTKEVMDRLIQLADFPIRYIKQENMGKQMAWNNAVNLSSTEFFCCVDSDDKLHDASVIETIFEKYHNNLVIDGNIMGIRGLTVSSKTLEVSGKKISDKMVVQSYFDEISNNKIIGERIDILKTEIIKKYKYPTSGIKFIPEIWFYVNSAKDNYKFIYVPDKIGFFYDETETNRLTRSTILNNALGHYISRSVTLKYTPLTTWISNPVFWIKTLIRFSQTSLYLKKTFSQRMNDTNLIYTILSYPISLIKIGFK